MSEYCANRNCLKEGTKFTNWHLSNMEIGFMLCEECFSDEFG